MLKQSKNEVETKLKRILDSSPKKPRQLNIDLFLKRKDLTEEQKVVVGVYARRIEEGKRPYVKVRTWGEFLENMGMTTIDAKGVKRQLMDEEHIEDLVVSLEVDNWLYIKQFPGYRKIGLLKSRIEELEIAKKHSKWFNLD